MIIVVVMASVIVVIMIIVVVMASVIVVVMIIVVVMASVIVVVMMGFVLLITFTDSINKMAFEFFKMSTHLLMQGVSLFSEFL